MTLPSAEYSSPSHNSHIFTVNSTDPRYLTTQGKTTGPSAYVLQAGQIDRDYPSDPKRNESGDITYLSMLRCRLTGLQDDINEFLTTQMEDVKSKKLKTKDTKCEDVGEKRYQDIIENSTSCGSYKQEDD